MGPWYVYVVVALVGSLTLMVSLLTFPGEEMNPFCRSRPFVVSAMCLAVSVATLLVSLLPWPAGWVLALGVSFVGIKVGFHLPWWLGRGPIS